MSIPITDKFKPKGAGGYPLMDAEDILMPDGTRLSDLDLDLKIATYDLVAMGLPTLNAEGEAVKIETDTTELTETIATSIVTIIVNIEYRGMVFKNIKATFPPNCNVATVDIIGIKMYVSVYVTEGQVLVRATVEQNSGVSSWNDLTDKPFYEESEAREVLKEQDLTFAVSPDFGCYATLVNGVTLTLGETYRVVWDNEEHHFTAVNYEALGGVGIGNAGLFGMGADTGETFCIGCIGSDIYLFSGENKDTHKVGIYQDNITIKTLDAKYLPSAVSVDLSAYESNGKIVETYADGSEVTTVMEFDENGKPIKITDSNGNVTVLIW